MKGCEEGGGISHFFFLYTCTHTRKRLTCVEEEELEVEHAIGRDMVGLSCVWREAVCAAFWEGKGGGGPEKGFGYARSGSGGLGVYSSFSISFLPILF